MRLLAHLALALLLLPAGSAAALTVSIEVVGEGSETLSTSALGCSTGGGIVDCAGSGLPSSSYNWTLDSWDVEAGSNPFVNANLALTNNSSSTQTYIMSLTEAASIAAPATSGASVGGSLTVDSSGGTVGHNGSTALYSALIDGSVYDTLLPDDSSVTAGFGSAPIGPDSFGLPGLTQAVPGGVSSSIGARFEFTLTPGDQASFTSSFEVVPEPGTALLALGGLAGLGAYRRRARA